MTNHRPFFSINKRKEVSIAQIPPPPMNVPMPIRKALIVDGENKAINYLIHGEYELHKTSWSQLQKKYNISRNKIYTALKGKG